MFCWNLWEVFSVYWRKLHSPFSSLLKKQLVRYSSFGKFSFALWSVEKLERKEVSNRMKPIPVFRVRPSMLHNDQASRKKESTYRHVGRLVFDAEGRFVNSDLIEKTSKCLRRNIHVSYQTAESKNHRREVTQMHRRLNVLIFTVCLAVEVLQRSNKIPLKTRHDLICRFSYAPRPLVDTTGLSNSCKNTLEDDTA